MKESREFKHRLIDSSERSATREHTRRARASRMGRLKKRYSTLLLGASLIAGGIGIPMKAARSGDALPTNGNQGISLKASLSGVAEGVSLAANNVSDLDPLEALDPAEAAEQIAALTEEAREEFFRNEVPFGSLIWEEAQRHEVDPELVAAVVQQESRFKPRAKSPVGAMGLMQLMPRTGKWMGAKNLYDPSDNVRAGAKYLRYLEGRFDGDQTKIIAAYNGGEGNVKKYGGIPPFKETRQYVQKVSKYKAEYENKVAAAAAEYIAEQNPVLAEMTAR